MKKYSLILLITLLMFIVACAPAQKTTVTTAKTEPKEDAKQVAEPIIKPEEISAEVKDLLSKHKIRIKSVYYKYKGPQTGNNFYEFYVKENRIKYAPARELKSLDQPDSYDVIFIDKAAKTAQSYCEAAYCAYKGKKEDLNYADAYIPTVFDWIDVTKAKKVGEEVIDDRSAWKLETNNGILWLDTFYGIPLKVESSGKTYRFQQISVNSVQDGDVMPS